MFDETYKPFTEDEVKELIRYNLMDNGDFPKMTPEEMLSLDTGKAVKLAVVLKGKKILEEMRRKESPLRFVERDELKHYVTSKENVELLNTISNTMTTLMLLVATLEKKGVLTLDDIRGTELQLLTSIYKNNVREIRGETRHADKTESAVSRRRSSAGKKKQSAYATDRSVIVVRPVRVSRKGTLPTKPGKSKSKTSNGSSGKVSN